MLAMLDIFTGRDPMKSWWAAIVVLLLVTLVVHVLLNRIIAAAGAIHETVGEVWVRGQRVANNTIHIANLYKTNEYVEGILGRAGRIAASSSAIEQHAKGCPGCPACFLTKKA